jgi:hypothetical protein
MSNLDIRIPARRGAFGVLTFGINLPEWELKKNKKDLQQ